MQKKEPMNGPTILTVIAATALTGLLSVTYYNTLTRLAAVERQLYELRSAIPGGKPTARAARPSLQPPSELVSIGQAATKGSSSAPIALIQYSDFQCPYCGVFARDVLPQIERNYVETGKVQIVFRHLPLDTLHPLARKAAVTAECARDKGAFWKVHDRLFSGRIVETTFSEIRSDFGISQSALDQCLSGAQRDLVERDVQEARRFGINGTPAILIGKSLGDGSVRVVHASMGAAGYGTLQSIIDGLLKQSS
jgi:protein-disulfide isomerase